MRRIVASLLALAAVTVHAQSRPTIGASAIQVTVTLTGSPQTGTCPYNMNLSWSAQNASTCSKSGAWSGTAAASGSEVVSVNAAQQTYTLTCSSNTDSRTISWTNPTQNTDGTAVTLSGNKLFHAASAAGVDTASPIVLTPAKTSYLLTGLPAGPRYVGVKATGPNPPALDSQMSPVANTTITLPSGADTLQAGCTPPPEPKPPTAVTISQTIWDVVPGREALLGRDVGTVELDVKCNGEKPWLTQADSEYWVVQKAKVTLYRKPRSTYVVGQCALKTI